jgi:hypothetical protein
VAPTVEQTTFTAGAQRPRSRRAREASRVPPTRRKLSRMALAAFDSASQGGWPKHADAGARREVGRRGANRRQRRPPPAGPSPGRGVAQSRHLGLGSPSDVADPPRVATLVEPIRTSPATTDRRCRGAAPSYRPDALALPPARARPRGCAGRGRPCAYQLCISSARIGPPCSWAYRDPCGSRMWTVQTQNRPPRSTTRWNLRGATRRSCVILASRIMRSTGYS